MVPPEIIPMTQNFLKSFISNDHFQFFDLYFDTLLRVIGQMNKKLLPAETQLVGHQLVNCLRYEVKMNLSLGFQLKSSLDTTTFELFSLLLIILQCFPKWEHFDKVQTATLIPVAGYVEKFIKQLSIAFIQPKYDSVLEDQEQNSTLSFQDLLFLAQEPLRLFMHRSEFKFCYTCLITTLALHSRDKFCYSKHISNLTLSVLKSKTSLEIDGEYISKLLVPFTQFMHQSYGLINKMSIVAVNNAYLRFIKRTKKTVNDLTYGFLSEIKFVPVEDASKVG